MIVYCLSFAIGYLSATRYNELIMGFLTLIISCITGYFSPQLTLIMLCILAFSNIITTNSLIKCVPVMLCGVLCLLIAKYHYYT